MAWSLETLEVELHDCMPPFAAVATTAFSVEYAKHPFG